MPPTQQPSFEESLQKVIATLPVPVQNYLRSAKYSAVAGQLAHTYGLHVDQAGILEREIMLLLMGIESPTEFSSSLQTEGAVPVDTVNKITADINQQIFIPLQAEMRSATVSKTFASRPAPQVNAPVPNYSAPVSAPTTGASLPPKVALPRPSVPMTPVAPSPLRAALQKALPVGEGSFPAMPKPVSAPQPMRVVRESVMATPAPAPVPQPVPRPVMSAPVNLPGAMPPVPAPTKAWAPSVVQTAPAPKAPVPQTPLAAGPKPYSVDPYREPVE